MRVEVRADGSVIIDGYVNAVERESRAIITARGKCNEVVKEGVFRAALEKANNVDILLDHNEARKLGSTSSGNLKLFEDNIGLRAIAEINDTEVAEKARQGLLRGWSFGMIVNSDTLEERADKLPLRTLTDIKLNEVSIIDEKMRPCYTATSIEMRADKEEIVEQRSTETTVEVETPKETINYDEFENRIKALHQV